MKKLAALAALSLFSASAQAVLVDFTGGTVHFNGGGTAVTNNSASYQDVDFYEQDGFRLDFVFQGGVSDGAFATIVGDYYGTGNDVFHAHWAGNGNQPSGPYGNVTEIIISRIDGTPFDLGGFRVSTNTAIGGSSSDGNELTWVSTDKGTDIFSVTPDSWGLGNGTDPLISINPGNTLFQGITYFKFTNDPTSSAVGLGLDNFFFDEPGDPDGDDPTPTPAPGILSLLAMGLIGIGVSRRKRSA